MTNFLDAEIIMLAITLFAGPFGVEYCVCKNVTYITYIVLSTGNLKQ